MNDGNVQYYTTSIYGLRGVEFIIGASKQKFARCQQGAKWTK
jgi:hypothetical protein